MAACIASGAPCQFLLTFAHESLNSAQVLRCVETVVQVTGRVCLQVLSIDDDVLVPCGDVAAAFAAWQRTADQMVGWFPRGHLLAADCTPRYLLRDAAVLLRGQYSMVLTKVPAQCCILRADDPSHTMPLWLDGLTT